MSQSPFVITGAVGGSPNRLEINDFVNNEKLFSLYIQALQVMSVNDQDQIQSFFGGGIHGLPNIPWDGATGDPPFDPSSGQWGGYSTHSSVLYEQILQKRAEEVAATYTVDTENWKQAAIGLRQPYWAKNAMPPDHVIVQKQVTITGKDGNKVTVDNPLYHYNFHPIDPSFPDPYSTTFRQPTSHDFHATDDATSLKSAFASAQSQITSSTNNLLSRVKTWPAFSNHTVGNGAITNRINQLYHESSVPRSLPALVSGFKDTAKKTADHVRDIVATSGHNQAPPSLSRAIPSSYSSAGPHQHPSSIQVSYYHQGHMSIHPHPASAPPNHGSREILPIHSSAAPPSHCPAAPYQHPSSIQVSDHHHQGHMSIHPHPFSTPPNHGSREILPSHSPAAPHQNPSSIKVSDHHQGHMSIHSHPASTPPNHGSREILRLPNDSSAVPPSHSPAAPHQYPSSIQVSDHHQGHMSIHPHPASTPPSPNHGGQEILRLPSHSSAAPHQHPSSIQVSDLHQGHMSIHSHPASTPPSPNHGSREILRLPSHSSAAPHQHPSSIQVSDHHQGHMSIHPHPASTPPNNGSQEILRLPNDSSAVPPSHSPAAPHQHPPSIQVSDHHQGHMSIHSHPASTPPNHGSREFLPSHSPAAPHQHPSSIQVSDHHQGHMSIHSHPASTPPNHGSREILRLPNDSYPSSIQVSDHHQGHMSIHPHPASTPPSPNHGSREILRLPSHSPAAPHQHPSSIQVSDHHQGHMSIHPHPASTTPPNHGSREILRLPSHSSAAPPSHSPAAPHQHPSSIQVAASDHHQAHMSIHPHPASAPPNHGLWEWTARVEFKKYELGTSFSVLIFLGQVIENPQEWRISPNYVGSHHAFVDSAASNQQDLVIEGFVHLNQAIVKHSGLESLEPNVVEPYLTRNLHWNVQKSNGEVAELQSLEVAVIATPLSYPPGAMFPVPGQGHRYNRITYGQNGGSRHA